VPARPARRPLAVPVTIAACAAAALFLRAYQLARPGYLFGVTEYDDGVLFGNALRLVSGVIPYRDFAVVQPPGSTAFTLVTPPAPSPYHFGDFLSRMTTSVSDLPEFCQRN
jgi:hypothetical protein